VEVGNVVASERVQAFHRVGMGTMCGMRALELGFRLQKAKAV
jgi:hypothetical protein